MAEKCQKCTGTTLFLLGILVGSILVGSLFFYRVYSAEIGGANLFRGLKMDTSPLYTTTTLTSISTGIGPVAAGDPQPW